MSARSIGIFGGTFDPIHVGHLVAAVNVHFALSLDRLLLVVANQPWQKEGLRSITPAEDRFAMVEAAVAAISSTVSAVYDGPPRSISIRLASRPGTPPTAACTIA